MSAQLSAITTHGWVTIQVAKAASKRFIDIFRDDDDRRGILSALGGAGDAGGYRVAIIRPGSSHGGDRHATQRTMGVSAAGEII